MCGFGLQKGLGEREKGSEKSNVHVHAQFSGTLPLAPAHIYFRLGKMLAKYVPSFLVALVLAIQWGPVSVPLPGFPHILIKDVDEALFAGEPRPLAVGPSTAHPILAAFPVACNAALDVLPERCVILA